MRKQLRAEVAFDERSRQEVRVTQWWVVQHQLLEPLHHASAHQQHMESIYVAVEMGGVQGIAEVRSDGQYATLESKAHINAALRTVHNRQLPVEQLIEMLLPQSKLAAMAVDVAAWDCYAKRLGLPWYKNFSEHTVEVVATHAQIPFLNDENLERRLREVTVAGFSRVKVRVGSDDIKEDLRRVRAVRAAFGPQAALMVDANGAWSVAQAMFFLESAADSNIEWLEQPVSTYVDLAEIFQLNETSTKIRVDESVRDLASVKQYADVSHGAHLKLEKVGTVQQLFEIATYCHDVGYQFALGQMDQGRLGCAVTTHLAASLGLDHAELWGCADIAVDPWSGLYIFEGNVSVPQNRGIGLAMEEGYFEG